MLSYTNSAGVPLSMAVFLASDFYDHHPNTISATKLLKPAKQIILAGRVPVADASVDITGMVKSRMGTAIHSGIEKAWIHNYVPAMTSLGYPDSVISRIVINPDDGEPLAEDAIPVYLEKRSFREFEGKRITGELDFLADGRIEDFKSTGTFSWGKTSKDIDYQLQGSIYRWLNPDIVTQDYMSIQFLFTDWMAGRAKGDPKYPPTAVECRHIPLLTIEATEKFISSKLKQLEMYKGADESEMPECDSHDLWQDEPTWKYYKNPTKLARSTKNFDNIADAHTRLMADGDVGVIKEIPGKAKACLYCDAFSICQQKDDLIQAGTLEL